MIKAIDAFLISENESMNFDLDMDNNIVHQQEMSMYNIIASLENNGVSNAKQLTVFELYQRIEYYKKLVKEMQRKQRNDWLFYLG